MTVQIVKMAYYIFGHGLALVLAVMISRLMGWHSWLGGVLLIVGCVMIGAGLAIAGLTALWRGWLQ